MTDIEWLAGILTALATGSFAGVLIDRLPRGEPVGMDRSRCRACGTALGPLDLVPVVSFLVRRGRCGHCSAVIPVETLLIELTALGVFVAAALAVPVAMVPATALLGWMLMTASWIDARHHILPDAITLPLLLIGLAVNGWFAGGIPREAVWGAVGGGLSFWLIRAAYSRLRGIEGLGLGDVKLFSALGAWVGWLALPSVALAATVAALAWLAVLKVRGQALTATTALPFGPFLALGGFIVWLTDPWAGSMIGYRLGG